MLNCQIAVIMSGLVTCLLSNETYVKEIEISPKCLIRDGSTCRIQVFDSSLSINQIVGLDIKRHSSIYVFLSNREDQKYIYNNNAVDFVFDMLGKEMETEDCKLLKLDASEYQRGKFFEPTPDDHDEYVLAVNKRHLGIVDASKCGADELIIRDAG